MKKAFLPLLLLIGFISIFQFSASAQLDTKHYIPPLFGREDEGTHYIVLSTPETTPFTVTIKDGSGAVITTQSISNASSWTYTLGSGTATPLLVDEANLNTVQSDEGLIIEGPKPFFVNIRVLAGAQAGSLTSKGVKAALGKDFRAGFLFNNDGDSYRKSNSIGIIATEDNTTVNIGDIRTGVILRGTTQSSVVLNAGESYVISAFMDEAGSTENVNGLNGAHITSDKNIAVSTATWLGGNAIVGGVPDVGRDIGIDQIVPEESIGKEYVAIKGEGIDNEKIIVVANEDGTEIAIDGNGNGVGTPVATINAGDYYVLDVNAYSANDNLFIQTSKEAYVYQSANGGDGATDDNERQVGLNFLPPIGCSGSKEVTLPEVDFIGTAYINIIANTGTTITVNGTTLGAGDAVTGTSDYVTYKLTSGYTGDVNIVADDLVRVALVNLSGNIGAAGYFSGFTKDVSVQTTSPQSDGIALEGCIPSSFTFGIDGVSDDDTQISYTIAGTATNGIDYDFIDTVLTIPAGQTEATIVINPIQDGFAEGQETIQIIFEASACADAPDTVWLYIDDADPIQFNLDGTDLTCFENETGEIQVNATGGFSPFTYQVTTDAGNGTMTEYTNNPITGLDEGQYSVQVYDAYGCKADALVIGGLYNAGTTFLPDGSGVSYTSDLNIAGFDAGEVIGNISQVQQVCATMEHSFLGDLQIKIISPTGEEVILKEFNGGGSCDLGEPFASDQVDGENSNLTDPGVGYDYCWNTSPNYGTMVAMSNSFSHTIPASTGGTYTDNYLPAGSYASFENLEGLVGAEMNGDWTIEVTDQFGLDNGYIFNWNISLKSDLPDTLVTIQEPTEIELSGFITQANCGGNDGAINLSVIGENDPFTFNWSNGETTEDISNIGAGTYKVIVTDDNLCSDSTTFNLNNISSMNITSSVTSVTCDGGSNGAIDVTPSGGTQPYDFSWSNGETSEDLSNIVAGTYTLTITDDNGCVFTEDIVVGTLPSINITLSTTANEFCAQSNGQINVNVTGGSGSYGFAWSNGATSQNIAGLSAGQYDLVVTDANGCTGNNSFNIVNDVSNCSAYCYLTVDANQVTDESCGDGMGTVNVNINDATLPYTVSWSNGETSDDITGLSAGTYSITVLDANQCSVTESFVVDNNSGTLDITSNQITNSNCGNPNGAIDIAISGGTSPYDVSWSNGATTEDISGVVAGDYTVTIIDDLGCTIARTYTINNNTGTMAQSATVSNEICGNNGGVINVTLTGGIAPYTFLWSNGSTNEDLTNVSAGTYSVTITDNVGCTLQSVDYTIVNDPGNLSILNSNIINEACSDGAGEIDINMLGGNAPLTFAWSNSETTEDLSGLSAGTYSATITDALGCEVETGDMVVFNSGGDLAISTTNLVDETCSNTSGEIDVTITGGGLPYTFNWSNGETSEDITGLSAGDYVLTLTDNNNCSLEYTETISNDPGSLTIESSNVTHESCGDASGEINVTVSGGTTYTFTWSNGETSQNLSGLSAGTYSLTVTDNNSCQVNTSATVNGSGINLISTNISDEICGDNAGSISLAFNGGQAPYSYSWSNGSISEDITGLEAGDYTLNMTDANGCTFNQTFSVGNNTNGLMINSLTTTDETCGDSNGAIDLDFSGGVNPIDIDWSNGESTEDLSDISAGNYTVTIEDAYGCSVNQSASIANISGGLDVTLASSTDESCGDGSGEIDVDIVGGTAPYVISWSNGESTEDLSNLNAGDYTITVTDDVSCSVNLTVTINNIAGTLALSNDVISNENCNNGSGFIDLTISGGQAPYTFAWSNGEATEDISGLSADTYTCVITDDLGCSINYSGTVSNNSGNLSVSENIISELCSGQNGEIEVTAAGGITPYTFTWSSGTITTNNNISTSSDLGAGNYSVTVTDAVGCEITDSYNVNDAPSNLQFSNINVQDDFCNQNAGEIEVTVTGGTPVNYLIDGAPGFGPPGLFFGLNAAQYQISVEDDAGCIIDSLVTVDNQASFTLSATSTDENCGQSNGAIDVSGTGTNFTYIWSNGETTEDLTSLSAGTYELTATNDADGCQDNISVTVVNIADITATSVVTNESCSDGTGAIDITVIGSTTLTYIWSNGASTEDLTGLSAGNYTCAINNTATGCGASIDVDVVNATSGIEMMSFINNDFCNQNGGSIDITTTGGSGNYTFIWSNGVETEDLNGLSSGSYTITAIDANDNCQIEETFEITNDAFFDLNLISQTDENCGDGTGAIVIEADAGGGPMTFTYDWSNGGTTAEITDLSAGSYTCTVNTDMGCSDVITVVVDNITDMNIQSNFVNEFCSDGLGSVDLTVTGSTDVSYEWSNGETTEDLTGLSAGTYTCTVTNNTSDCVEMVSVEVLNITTGVELLGGATNENCSDQFGEINLLVTGGSGTFTYNWSNGETTEDLFGLSAGDYTLTLTDDADGCSLTETYTVENILTFNVSSVLTESTCPACTDGAIDLTITDAGFPDGPYTVTWSNGQSTEDIDNLEAGIYTATVVSASGCSYSETFEIINNNSSVGLVENDQLSISVYPNPAQNNIFVNYELTKNTNVAMQIMSIEGKVVYADVLTDVNGTLEINTSDLGDGVYFINLKSESVNKTIKFVVAR